MELKGFGTPQQIWRVHQETSLSGQSEALFASSPHRLWAVTQSWNSAAPVASDDIRRYRVALISGEPGIGKSRLLAALEERLTNVRHFSLRYFCSPHHQYDAFYPIISRWEREVGFSRADTPEDRLRKLEAIVASRGLEPTICRCSRTCFRSLSVTATRASTSAHSV